MSRVRRLRPPGLDDLGLRRALGDGLLPLLVAAMAFLAALALAGSAGAAALVRHWEQGAAAALTVQVPTPLLVATDAAAGTRLEAVLAALRATQGVVAARALSAQELHALLRPWLGAAAGASPLPLPAVIAVRLSGESGPDLAGLQARLADLAPGALVEGHGAWVRRLALLARSLQACAWLALAVVAAVAAAVVAVATRAGLAARRDAIEIVHGLGATHGYIAARFAARITRLAALGGVVGSLAALPAVAGLAVLAAPFVATPGAPAPTALAALPGELVLGLPALPLIAAAIGFVTAQATVRLWLRRLP
jgi:cell division transport system permease protein